MDDKKNPAETTEQTASNNGTDNSTNTKPETISDIFSDVSKLQISQDFIKGFQVKKRTVEVVVRKPAPTWFIRTSPNLRLEIGAIELKEEQELYFVIPSLHEIMASLEKSFGFFLLQGAITAQNTFFFWPLRLSDSKNRQAQRWNQSALELATIAENTWIRVSSNMQSSCYEATEPKKPIPDPVWPTQSLGELMRIAFKGGLSIENLDHPVWKELQGE